MNTPFDITGRFVRAGLLASLIFVVYGSGQPATSAPTTLEPFEGPLSSWLVQADTAGGGTIDQSTARAAAGTGSARLTTASTSGRAQIRVNFSDAASAHSWNERPGTWFWQRTSVYMPATTVSQLAANEYVTLAGLWPSNSNNYGWFLRVRQGGALYVVGSRDWDNAQLEFPIYGVIPQDRWFQLELGLHSQAGPGVKRAFAFVIDGSFYGWYHQGRMKTETYDRAAVGVLNSNTGKPLQLFVDEWGTAGSASVPTGSDNRSTATLQQQDYRNGSGIQWQIDWTTWSNSLRLHPQFGLYSASDRVQSGRNIDRMPDVSNGWAEIEIDWPSGTPPQQPSSYFGPMVGFRKEINREQNLEVIPIGRGGGRVDLVFEAWDGNGAVVLARWPMPMNPAGTSAVPTPGDIIRVRWQQLSSTSLEVRSSYFDQSAGLWYDDVINGVFQLANINGVNFFDGFHAASSITIDSIYYSIRRYTVGTLATYPSPGACSATLAPTSQSFGAGGGNSTTAVTTLVGCAWTASSNANWIKVTSGSSGSGNGTMGYAVASNPSSSTRTGTVSAATQTLTVTQAGVSCTFSATPTSASYGSNGGTGTVAVGAATGCAWTATSHASWITVTSGTSGSGNGSVGYAAATHSGGATRTGTITVAGQTVTITQTGAACSYSVSTVSVSFSASGGTRTVSVTTTAGCAWTAVSKTPSWITVTSGANGTGNGSVAYSVAVNSSASTRTGSLTIAGQTVNVSQAGTSPSGPVTLILPVNSSTNDVNEVNGTLTTDATTAWLGNGESTTTSYTGLRFTNATIPPGAAISSARLNVTSSQDQWIPIGLSIAADQAGNSAAFNTTTRPSLRTQTASKVTHSSNVKWLANTLYSLDEMKTVIQEIVNRPDWQSGNSLSIIIKGTSSGAYGRKFVRSVDADASTAPKLVVTYTPN